MALKNQKFYNGWDRTAREVSVEDVFTEEEFLEIFGNHGIQIQPTPTNKPNSSVTIRDLDKDALLAVFGKLLSSVKGAVWSKGGKPGGFNRSGGSGFTKSIKLLTSPITVTQARLTYHANQSKLSVKFSCINQGDDLDLL